MLSQSETLLRLPSNLSFDSVYPSCLPVVSLEPEIQGRVRPLFYSSDPGICSQGHSIWVRISGHLFYQLTSLSASKELGVRAAGVEGLT